MRVRKATRSTRIKDSLVVLKNGKIVEVTTNESPYRAYPVICAPYDPRIGVRLPWEKVGVYRYRGLKYDEVIEVAKEDIVGKAIISGGIITVWLKDWFLSKVDD